MGVGVGGVRIHFDFTLVHNPKSVGTRIKIKKKIITPHIQIPCTTPLHLTALQLNHNGTDPQYIGGVEPVNRKWNLKCSSKTRVYLSYRH